MAISAATIHDELLGLDHAHLCDLIGEYDERSGGGVQRLLPDAPHDGAPTACDYAEYSCSEIAAAITAWAVIERCTAEVYDDAKGCRWAMREDDAELDMMLDEESY